METVSFIDYIKDLHKIEYEDTQWFMEYYAPGFDIIMDIDKYLYYLFTSSEQYTKTLLMNSQTCTIYFDTDTLYDIGVKGVEVKYTFDGDGNKSHSDSKYYISTYFLKRWLSDKSAEDLYEYKSFNSAYETREFYISEFEENISSINEILVDNLFLNCYLSADASDLKINSYYSKRTNNSLRLRDEQVYVDNMLAHLSNLYTNNFKIHTNSFTVNIDGLHYLKLTSSLNKMLFYLSNILVVNNLHLNIKDSGDLMSYLAESIRDEDTSKMCVTYKLKGHVLDYNSNTSTELYIRQFEDSFKDFRLSIGC